MSQTRAADDFATIKARLEELRRERERAERAEKGLPSEPPSPGDSSDPIAIRPAEGRGWVSRIRLDMTKAKPTASP